MDEVNKYNCNVLFVIRNLIRMNLYDLVQSTMCFHLLLLYLLYIFVIMWILNNVLLNAL